MTVPYDRALLLQLARETLDTKTSGDIQRGKLLELFTKLIEALPIGSDVPLVVDQSSSGPVGFSGIGFVRNFYGETTPIGGTTAAVKTVALRHTHASSQLGAWTGTSHPIGGFDILELSGENDFAQAFGHESRLDNLSTGELGEFAFYKAVLGQNAGQITQAIGLDFPDFSSLAPTAERIAVNVRDSSARSELLGGLVLGKSEAFASRSLAVTDAGKLVVCAKETGTLVLTLTTDLPVGSFLIIIQAGAAPVVFSAGPGTVLVNYANPTHDRTRTVGSVAFLFVTSPGVYIPFGDTAAP